MSINRKYKYADELEEGDVVALNEAIEGLPLGKYETEQVWYSVHKPRIVPPRPGLDWKGTLSPEGIAGMLLPIDGERKPVVLEGWATRIFEVATIESHPEVLQQLVDQISDLQATPEVVHDDDPDADELPMREYPEPPR